MAHLVQLLLPLHDNDGAQIPRDVFSAVRRELTDRFGGVTLYSRAPAEGLWKPDEGTVERDVTILVEVLVSELDRDWWRSYLNRLEGQFGQDKIHGRALAAEAL